MQNKSDAIAEIHRLMATYNITADELASPKQKAGSEKIQRIFEYFGGILIFAGLGVFIATFWEDIGFGGRVTVTFGVGFFLYLIAIIAAKGDDFPKLATPFFLISSLLQPTGLLLILDHFSSSQDPAKALCFVSLFMLLQQIPAFLVLRRSVLVFTILLFYGAFLTSGFDILGVLENYFNWIGMIIGFSYILICMELTKTRYAAVTGFWFFIGALIFLLGLWDLVDNSLLEILYLGGAALLVYLSTLASSRSLLLIGTLAMLWYIGDFSFKYFENSLGWPVVLIIIGLSCIGLGKFALKINRKIAQG